MDVNYYIKDTLQAIEVSKIALYNFVVVLSLLQPYYKDGLPCSAKIP